MMTLLFGNLVQQFVKFSATLANANAGVAGASDLFTAASAEFRNSAANLAAGVVYIGVLHAYI